MTYHRSSPRKPCWYNQNSLATTYRQNLANIYQPFTNLFICKWLSFWYSSMYCTYNFKYSWVHKIYMYCINQQAYSSTCTASTDYCTEYRFSLWLPYWYTYVCITIFVYDSLEYIAKHSLYTCTVPLITVHLWQWMT